MSNEGETATSYNSPKEATPPVPKETQSPTQSPVPEETQSPTQSPVPKEATPPVPKETQSPTQSPVPKEATPPVSPVPKEGIPRPTLAVPDMTTISMPEPKVLYTPEAQLSIRKTTEPNTPVKSKFDDISEKINNQNIPEISKTTTKWSCGCSIQ
jgi:hypothetical protein